MVDAIRLVPELCRFPVDTAAFVVVQPGTYAGRWYTRGEVLLAEPALALPGEPVILVARDSGRPRLGCLRGSRLFGDADEPCSAVRWSVAGRAVLGHPQLQLFAA
jgi:hypothetical protein